VIVVVGNPRARQVEHGLVASGAATTVGRVAAAAGADVQLIGKVGEGPAGDAVMLSLADLRIGHVAVLRDVARTTPILPHEPDDDGAIAGAIEEPVWSAVASTPDGRPEPAPEPTLDSGDLQLALRYLPDYRVVVVADPLDEASLATVVAASRWAEAQLIVLVPAGAAAAGLPDDATILETPSDDLDGAFATMVGAYAAALDRGASPADAFASASTGSGWSAVAD
jgi:hypothetical protein